MNIFPYIPAQLHRYEQEGDLSSDSATSSLYYPPHDMKVVRATRLNPSNVFEVSSIYGGYVKMDKKNPTHIQFLVLPTDSTTAPMNKVLIGQWVVEHHREDGLYRVMAMPDEYFRKFYKETYETYVPARHQMDQQVQMVMVDYPTVYGNEVSFMVRNLPINEEKIRGLLRGYRIDENGTIHIPLSRSLDLEVPRGDYILKSRRRGTPSSLTPDEVKRANFIYAKM